MMEEGHSNPTYIAPFGYAAKADDSDKNTGERVTVHHKQGHIFVFIVIFFFMRKLD